MTSKLNGHINIYDVVKKEKLDIVNQPISQAHGLPNECYNKKEYTIYPLITINHTLRFIFFYPIHSWSPK